MADSEACGSNFTFTLENISGQSCTLTQVEFTNWPDANNQNGRLTSVSVGGTTVASDASNGNPNYFAPTFISETVGLPWIDPDDPALEFGSGDSKTVSFGFRNSADAGVYAMTLRFSPRTCESLVVTHQCRN